MEKKYKWPWSGLFYYMTHKDNLDGILNKGIFSRTKIKEEGIKPKLISDEEIVSKRGEIINPIYKKSLNDYANVYFRIQNAMHYRVVKKTGAGNIVIICIKKDILKIPKTIISDGNAASFETKFYLANEWGRVIKKIKPNLQTHWWSGKDAKRQIMAECLVPEKISPNYISKIIVLNKEILEKIKLELGETLSSNYISPVAHLDFFNQPLEKEKIDNITLLEGDMFFSEKQTLTVSVNMVGIMGRGLASNVKDIFHDVYTKYLEVLNQKKLSMGRPYLYKRDKSIMEDLGEAEYIEDEEPTWFLIFPTKNNWRFRSDKEGIEKGLIYLKENYKKWGIKSLALPALGCGLGWLSWEEIGPLMVKHLKEIEIPVEIYLPQDKRIPKEQKTKEFLLSGSKK